MAMIVNLTRYTKSVCQTRRYDKACPRLSAPAVTYTPRYFYRPRIVKYLRCLPIAFQIKNNKLARACHTYLGTYLVNSLSGRATLKSGTNIISRIEYR